MSLANTFAERNARRSLAAAQTSVPAARQALKIPTIAEVFGEELRARIEHPDATLEELGLLLGLTKDQYNGRLRRALLKARQAAEQATR